MLTFTFSSGVLRIAGGSRGLTVYAPKPAQAEDLLLQSIPEETPSNGIVSWPGEYDISGITLRGIGHDEGKQVSFLAVIDGMRCAFPSAPITEWTDADLEHLGDVDVLVLPDGDAKKIQHLVDEIDPRVLILLPGEHSAETLRTVGAQDKEAVSEYKLKSLPQDGRDVVVMG